MDVNIRQLVLFGEILAIFKCRETRTKSKMYVSTSVNKYERHCG